jgi:hypothetical protein
MYFIQFMRVSMKLKSSFVILWMLSLVATAVCAYAFPRNEWIRWDAPEKQASRISHRQRVGVRSDK